MRLRNCDITWDKKKLKLFCKDSSTAVHSKVQAMSWIENLCKVI